MDRLLRLAHAIARLGAWAAGLLLVAVALLIGVDILLRNFFARSIGGADELAGYGLAIATSWGLAFTLLQRAHIRIESLHGVLPAWPRAVLDVLGLALFTLFVAVLGWHAWGVLAQSWRFRSRSLSRLAIPLVIPQVLWVAGLAFFVLAAVLLLSAAVAALARRDLAGASRLIGSRAVLEEIEEHQPDVRR
jgi:TRAP-type C4-dicarboxylate transport system permease small subunit